MSKPTMHSVRALSTPAVVTVLVKDSDRHEIWLKEHDKEIELLKIGHNTLTVKLSIYVTVAAALGGVVASLLNHFIA